MYAPPRFNPCSCGGAQRILALISDLLPERVSPELCNLQIKPAVEVPYRKARGDTTRALPDTGGLSHETNRNRTLAVGKRIDKGICDEIDHPQPVADPAPKMIVGIDGAFVNAMPTKMRSRHQIEF